MYRQLQGDPRDLAAVLKPALPALAQATLQDDDFFEERVKLLAEIWSPEVLEHPLYSVLRMSLHDAVKEPLDVDRLVRAVRRAQAAQMDSDIDLIVRPALPRTFLAAARGADWDRLEELLQLTMAMDLTRELSPTARLLIDTLTREPESLTEVCFAYRFATMVDLPDLKEITEDKIKPSARKAVLRLAERTLDKSALSEVLEFIVELQIKEAVGVVLRSASDKEVPLELRARALRVVACLGSRDDVPRLEALMTDDHFIVLESGATLIVQIRDVALGAAVQLSGQKLGDYFPYYRKHPAAPFALGDIHHLDHLALDNDEAREAAQEKWKASRRR